ncbi:hypothetical protein FRACYDRAFT_236560 [Fragilariopsis cylindrus CCMP1102]|uniref:Ankyrin n=1 Tax=Fragilariopsis cylindrus CCMP1102 TaxID=635003 RepID=A0A1E7FJI3_9STRA|nr:hypothetical protein FRACYDRAFT_236560 [Fragilariopsis cylindrus CCMP1102]|eukprot:OEU18284.1 hypothetical protein FRACYDRAFT_236560 [Fragilariopsis cylindrus CCMP1102]
MNDANNIDIEDVQQAQAQAAQDEQQQQQQQQQAVVLLKKMILVLEQKETFPLQTRNKTDALVENFLEKLGNHVHDMLCDMSDDNDGDENYRGLDSDRDTEEEVEAILRFFPEVLHRGGDHGVYPIRLLASARDEDGSWKCNVKAVSFIHIVARLTIEFGLFEGDDRGGLLCEDFDGCNVLHVLMLSDKIEVHNQEHYEYIDTQYLQVLIQLRQLDLLKKEDIQSSDLLNELCGQCYFFAEKRLRFLVEWDPNALLHPTDLNPTDDDDGYLPIHCAAEKSYSIQRFQLIFEYGICYFPKKKGISLIFKKNNRDGHTPFQYACKKFGYEQGIKVVEETLIRCYSSSDNTPPLNIVEALLSAAIDKAVHLDCLYFLLRRQPDVIQKLLSLTTPTVVVAMDSNNNIGNKNNNGINDGENDDNLSQRRMNPIKRKRKRQENMMNDDDNN